MDLPENNQSYCSQFLQRSAVDNGDKLIGLRTLQRAVKIVHTFPNEAHQDIIGYFFTQMSGIKGIKKHGAVAIKAITDMFSQLDSKGVFEPIKRDELTDLQWKNALRTIILIKEKRKGKLKGHTVADGRPQRQLYTKEQTMLPTISDSFLYRKATDSSYWSKV